MNDVITHIQEAFARGQAARPKVGGFPYLAEALRQGGVRTYLFDVPSSSVLFVTDDATVLAPGTPLRDSWCVLAPFDEPAVVAAIRADQRGETTFPEFVEASLRAGVVRYEVDFAARTCTYMSARGDRYVERYPNVELPTDR